MVGKFAKMKESSFSLRRPRGWIRALLYFRMIVPMLIKPPTFKVDPS